MDVIVPKIERIAVGNEGPNVLVRIGSAGAGMPYEQARVLARELLRAAARAEESVKAEAIALDQALLLRGGGFPMHDSAGNPARMRIGLTSDPKILDMAATEAAHNRELRRALPGGVQATAHMPPPGVFATTMPAGNGTLDPSKIIRSKEQRT